MTLEEIKPEKSFQIVAVTFHDIDKISMKLSPDHSGKPYFYVDPYFLKEGDLAAVFSSELKIVRVVRVIDPNSAEAAAWIRKPILFPVNYDHEIISAAAERITQVQAIGRDVVVQEQIDKILGGKDRPPAGWLAKG